MIPQPSFSVHHVHPILVNFTAALVPASVGSDLLGKMLRKRSLNGAGSWMLLYAAIVTPLTAAAGMLWRREVAAFQPPAVLNTHMWLGLSLSVLFIMLAWWRRAIDSRDGNPGLGYFAAAVLVTIVLVYQGTIGGFMAFGS